MQSMKKKNSKDGNATDPVQKRKVNLIVGVRGMSRVILHS
jgi:hypothetical protein